MFGKNETNPLVVVEQSVTSLSSAVRFTLDRQLITERGSERRNSTENSVGPPIDLLTSLFKVSRKYGQSMPDHGGKKHTKSQRCEVSRTRILNHLSLTKISTDTGFVRVRAPVHVGS